MFRNKTTYIFDLDGTLIDTVGMWNRVDALLLTFLGGEPMSESDRQARRDALLEQFRKETDPYLAYCGELGSIYKSTLTPAEIKKKRYDIAEEFLRNSVTLKPGAAELLHGLKNAGKKLILASTTSRTNVNIYSTENRGIYEKAHFPSLFSQIYTREDVPEIKPSPAVHQKILNDLSVFPEECIVIEDSLAGVQAANAAGIDVVCIYDTYSEKDAEILKKQSLSYFSDCFALFSAISASLLLDKPNP